MLCLFCKEVIIVGYFAKDGSYVRDDSDTKFAEVMNESQGQEFERKQMITAQAEAYEREQKREAEARRTQEAEMRYEAFQAENRRAAMARQQVEKELIQKQKQENLNRYGVDYSLRNPKDLDERRRRANFWRINNNFRLLVDTVIGKNYRFGKLWEQYSTAKTDEERQQIVEKMEKMYPTREFAVRSVEKRTGYHR